ncbi:MAG: hypothetical protein QOH17_3869 [Pseudonocardiales bacterium]|nr:hypothetical protein [Pseudonocardiales bacterium]
MALFGRDRGLPDRRPSTTVAGLADPVRHAEWIVRLGPNWQLLTNHGTVLALTNPDHSYSVRSLDGHLLTQTDIAVVDTDDVAAAAFAGLHSAPDRRAKLQIRDTRSRMIVADCHRASDGIVIRVLPGGVVNQKLVARALEPDLAEAVIRSGPWTYRVTAPGQGELRGHDGQLFACDAFTRSTPADPPDRRGNLIWWTIRIDENPFPTSWLFAVLLACEHLRR